MKLALGAVALLAVPSLAQDDPWQTPPPPWEGVWRGTIGTLAVHLCLDTTPYRQHGAYYYDRHRALIRLELNDDKKSWTERSADDRTGPRWMIAAQGKDLLAGSWSDGRRSLPVRLRRIGAPSAEFEGPCGSVEFQRPRLKLAKIVKGRLAKDGAALTSWRFAPGAPFDNVEVSTFTLDRPGPAVARVNALLKAILPKTDGTGEWLDCMAGNANAHGADGEFSNSIEPAVVTSRWLATTQRSDDYCGGNHPNTKVRFRTFDLDRGAEVDPLDWFGPKAVKRERYDSDTIKTLTPAFRKALLAEYKSDEECDGVVAGQAYWTVGIERGALVFWPQLARVVMACSEDFKLPFARLGPWLTAEGKAAVATLPR